MQIQIAESDDQVTVAFLGSLVGSDSFVEKFEQVQAIVHKKPRAITLNLEQVVFIDSMFVGLLVGIFLKCKETGIQLKLEPVSQPVREILEGVGVDQIISF